MLPALTAHVCFSPSQNNSSRAARAVLLIVIVHTPRAAGTEDRLTRERWIYLERKPQIKDCSSFINRPKEKKKNKKIGQITLNFPVKQACLSAGPQGQAAASGEGDSKQCTPGKVAADRAAAPRVDSLCPRLWGTCLSPSPAWVQPAAHPRLCLELLWVQVSEEPGWAQSWGQSAAGGLLWRCRV